MSTHPPLIGISSSEFRRPQVGAHATEIALGLTYIQAVRAAGGLPVILPPVDEEQTEALLAHLQGIVFSGGPDIHPQAYGQSPHPLGDASEEEADAFELRLCALARSHTIPVLGLCRGLQIINVCAGGSLHQHLPDAVGNMISHRHSKSDEGIHRVDVVAGTKLAAIMGEGVISVNSSHHQAVDTLAQGFVVSARAEDGVIEAIEDVGEGWVLGVQWHAEAMIADASELALFEALVSAAAGKSA
jgi:putative glutamine amidotransferase